MLDSPNLSIPHVRIPGSCVAPAGPVTVPQQQGRQQTHKAQCCPGFPLAGYRCLLPYWVAAILEHSSKAGPCVSLGVPVGWVVLCQLLGFGL